MTIFFPKDTVIIVEDKLDIATNLSVNQFCPVCSGFYRINAVPKYDVDWHILNLTKRLKIDRREILMEPMFILIEKV